MVVFKLLNAVEPFNKLLLGTLTYETDKSTSTLVEVELRGPKCLGLHFTYFFLFFPLLRFHPHSPLLAASEVPLRNSWTQMVTVRKSWLSANPKVLLVLKTFDVRSQVNIRPLSMV